MDFGFHVMDFTVPDPSRAIGPLVTEAAVTAEDVGASWVTVMDHFFQMEQFRTAHDPMVEAYTTLGFIAAKTSRVKVGALVGGVTYRHPGLLAKTATTLDVLSGGRAIFGIGAAWYQREHDALGVPFPPLKERFERLEETLQICLQMWGEGEGPYEGTHYRLAETINVPAAVSAPHPPIMIGGGGEKKTLRLVAKYAQISNLAMGDPDEVAHKLRVLRGHCDAEGTDYDAITKTVIGGRNLPEDVDGFLAEMEQLAALGITHVQVPVSPATDPRAFITDFGERVGPRLAQIG